MLSKLLLLIIVIASLGFAGDAPAGPNRANAVTWMHADFPPIHILTGPYAGTGPADMIHELMRREMPDLTQGVITASLPRTLNWMAGGEHVLAVGLIPTPERERIMCFSMPCTLVPPVCLVVRAGDEGQFMRGDRASLREFISSRRLGMAAGRSYGMEIDAVLRQAGNGADFVVNADARLFDGLMEMLLLKRVDGVLAYPFEAVYVSRMKGKENKISLVPLKEALLPVMGRIAAPRTAWGRDMIGRVNGVLLRHRGDPEYRQAFERWLEPDAVADYRAMYEDFLRTR